MITTMPNSPAGEELVYRHSGTTPPNLRASHKTENSLRCETIRLRFDRGNRRKLDRLLAVPIDSFPLCSLRIFTPDGGN